MRTVWHAHTTPIHFGRMPSILRCQPFGDRDRCATTSSRRRHVCHAHVSLTRRGCRASPHAVRLGLRLANASAVYLTSLRYLEECGIHIPFDEDPLEGGRDEG